MSDPELLIPGDNVLEVDQRQNDNLTVTLWYVRNTMSTFVTVEDQRFGDNFSVDVPTPEQAMEVFHHPYVFREAQNGTPQ